MLPEKEEIKTLVLNEASLRLKLLRQIEKDLRLDADSLGGIVQSKTFVSDLYRKLYPVVKQLAHYEPESFLNLLYIIDVSENELKGKLRAGGYSDFTELVVAAIIEREAQKVYMRQLFAKG